MDDIYDNGANCSWCRQSKDLDRAGKMRVVRLGQEVEFADLGLAIELIGQKKGLYFRLNVRPLADRPGPVKARRLTRRPKKV